MSIAKIRLKDGRTVYRVRYHEGKRSRSRTFDLKKQAQAFEDGRREQMRLGAFARKEPDRQLAAEYVETWFEAGCRPGGWAANTCRVRGHLVDRWITPYLDGVRLCDLDEARVASWFAVIQMGGAKPRTANPRSQRSPPRSRVPGWSARCRVTRVATSSRCARLP